MNELVSAVRAFIGAQHMIRSRAPLVVAVSGGPDSLCLLHMLRELAPGLGVALHVAHLDHQIRGAESAAEARFVADLARDWGIPVTIGAIDVPAQAEQQRTNLHAAARVARYGFLAEVAQAVGAQAVAVAHHAGDQAETLLLHALRGAGSEGLSGMRSVVPWHSWAPTSDERDGALLIRPLLPLERSAIDTYCATHGLAPRYDPSNLDRSATRNRIRHELLPQLIEYNPHIVAALGRTASICADEHDYLAAALEAEWPQLATCRAAGIDIDGAVWRALHPALQRLALRQAYHMLVRGPTLTFEQVEQARALVQGGVGGLLPLPGEVMLRVGYGGSFTLGEQLPPDGPQLPEQQAALPEQGMLALGEEWVLVITPGSHPPTQQTIWQLQLDAGRLPGPLLVRRRKPGDRLRLGEGQGSRRVQDILVDAKVPRALRAAWPLVATASALIWVVGARAANEYRAGPGCSHVVTLDVVRG